MWALVPLSAHAQDVAHGARLAGLASCAACHTADGGEPYAGGHAVVTDFGTFYGPNLTPDPTHGLGAWTAEDFLRAMTRGRSPETGHRYWAAFPYPSLSRMTEPDLLDLWAFLRTLPPSPTPDLPHDTKKSATERWAWHLLFFDRGAWKPLPDPTLDLGTYLVDAVGHCGECHSPRGRLGRVRQRDPLSGSDLFPHGGPDLRPGTLAWSDGDWDTFLELGMLPDGDFAGKGMYAIVREGTSKLTPEERAALVKALQTPR